MSTKSSYCIILKALPRGVSLYTYQLRRSLRASPVNQTHSTRINTPMGRNILSVLKGHQRYFEFRDNHCLLSQSLSTARSKFDQKSFSFRSSSSSTSSLPSNYLSTAPVPAFRTYLYPWSNNNKDIEPLEFNTRLDRQSRFLLSLLQTFYFVGLTKTADRVTTQRANFIIQKLLEDDSFDNGDNATTSAENRSSSSVASASSDFSKHIWQKAERARAILEAMELFEEFRTDFIQRPEIKMPFPLPLPNHETYWNVLRLYSNKNIQSHYNNHSETVTAHQFDGKTTIAPHYCMEIVQRMQASGRLELKPTALHWNQVLAAWANSNHPERSIEAAKLLYTLHENQTQTQQQLGATIHGSFLLDESSFSHTLRACAPLSSRGLTTIQESPENFKKFQQLAVPVAMRVWKALLKEHEKPNSMLQLQTYHVVHMLRVCWNLQPSSSSDSGAGVDQQRYYPKRSVLVKEIMDKAIETSNVNIYVLQALFQLISNDNDKVEKMLLEEYFGTNHSMNPFQEIKKIPREWLSESDNRSDEANQNIASNKDPSEW